MHGMCVPPHVEAGYVLGDRTLHCSSYAFGRDAAAVELNVQISVHARLEASAVEDRRLDEPGTDASDLDTERRKLGP